jgi:hypothetical protein
MIPGHSEADHGILATTESSVFDVLHCGRVWWCVMRWSQVFGCRCKECSKEQTSHALSHHRHSTHHPRP